MPFGADSDRAGEVRRLDLDTVLRMLPGDPAALRTSPICLRATDHTDFLVFVHHDANAEHL
ncbi:hypothetical protein [Renibacterium salmoninarum]|uniref:hypothetical protein n=1 Tax=Renibacterium salmoninarum TaxID=1646 RepID=UPI0002E39C17|nr:hypothetical protein [Renibacterium salmoninarum]